MEAAATQQLLPPCAPMEVADAAQQLLPPCAPGSEPRAADPAMPVWLKLAVEEAGPLCSAWSVPLPELEPGPAAPGGSEAAPPLPAPPPGLEAALSDPGFGGCCWAWRPPPGLEEGFPDPCVSKTGKLLLIQQPQKEAEPPLKQPGALSTKEGLTDPDVSETGLVDPIPRDSDKGLPSVGSQGHDEGLCKPCLFWLSNICRKGEECCFCHMPHKRHSKRIRPSKKTRKKWAARGLTVSEARAAALLGDGEAVACDGFAAGAPIAQGGSQHNGPEGKSAAAEYEPWYIGLPQWAVPLPLDLHAQV